MSVVYYLTDSERALLPSQAIWFILTMLTEVASWLSNRPPPVPLKLRHQEAELCIAVKLYFQDSSDSLLVCDNNTRKRKY